MNLKTTISLLAVAAIVGQGSLIQPLVANAQETFDNALGEAALQVASVIQKPGDTQADVLESPSLNLPIPATPEKQEPGSYLIDMADGSRIEMHVTGDDEAASVYLNAKEVIRFRSGAGGITPLQRALMTTSKLSSLLQDEELATEDVKAGILNKQFVILMGDEMVATADVNTAKSAKSSPSRLAFIWANQMRSALGADPLAETDYRKLAVQDSTLEPGYRSTGRVQTGMASWYGPAFHGRRSADGSRFNMNSLTAAHRTLPFGTLVRVKNNRTQKSCIVRITDRGPYSHGRLIDLSKGAAKAIGMLSSGVANVTIEVVKPDNTLATVSE